MTIYLGERAPRWHPSTEAELRSAIEEGLLRETHYLDMKRETGSTSGERKETARDLSSFALDGGALLIGIEEDKANRTWSLSPQPLDGLAEKIEQIAVQLVDPPLFVVIDDIAADAGVSTGYLFVQIPASIQAPHMVDGVYYGRATVPAFDCRMRRLYGSTPHVIRASSS